MRVFRSFSFLPFVSLSAASPDAQVPGGLISTASAPNAVRCKVIPDSPQWPSEADWASLNRTIKGRLLKPDPPAAACHAGYPSYDSSACEAVIDGFKDSTWHINHPTSNMWQNFNNYSCMPGKAGTCTNSGYPIYVVKAREPADVKAAVDFARKKNVRLNIKSTGHDFLGRSVQPNSLSIWTHSLKKAVWHDTSFTPKGCGFTINGPSVTAGSGNQWKDLNSVAKRRNVALVGGAFDSVGLGGYLANGGHGRLSAKYGLGADMVLEIELVNAAGEIITANECQNQDYFWAMRGGGGSTYGVVLTYTLQAIPTVPVATYYGPVKGWDELAYIHTQWPKLAMAGASGYLNGYPARDGKVNLSVNLPNATSDQLHAIIDPILAGMHARSGSSSSSSSSSRDEDDEERRHRSRPLSASRARGVYTDFATWGEAESNLRTRSESSKLKSFPGMGANKILVSWLYNADAVSNPGLKEALRGALSDKETQYLNDATMGIGTHNPPYIRGGGNAVNPAFRTAVMRPAAELAWSGTDPAKLAKKKADAQRYGASLMSLWPQGGTYANEADADTTDWQHAFWGSNYERLLSIKKRVDPNGVFYCRACVGSELFADVEGVLCRV